MFHSNPTTHSQAVDRLESAKAGAFAAVGGVASSAPLLLATGGTDGLSNLLSIGTVLATSLLLGVTYRHTVREDMQDVHLKVSSNPVFLAVHAMCTTPSPAVHTEWCRGWLWAGACNGWF